MEDAEAAAADSTSIGDIARMSDAAGALFTALGSLLQRTELAASDDFYDVGGDSLLAVRLSGQLHNAGWRLAVATILRAETLGVMADQMRPAAADVVAEPEPESSAGNSPFPLAPIQLDALELRAKNPDLFNLSAVFALPSGITPAQVERGVRMVKAAHDMLRARLWADNGEWRQMVMAPSPTDATLVAEVSPADHSGVESIAQEQHNGLSLAEGRVCSFVTLVDESAAWGLLIVVHHMVTDAIGWDVLVEDLGAAVASAQRGADQVLPRSSPYHSWVRQLCGLAHGRPWSWPPDDWFGWLANTGCAEHGERPGRAVVLRRETERRTRRHPLSDRAAFGSLSKRYGADVVVLACLNYALAGSSAWGTGIVDTFSNARHLVVGDHDFTRTMGWFSVKSPMVIDTRRATSPEDFLERTAEASSALQEFRAVYGALRYHSPDRRLRRRIVDAPAADVCLNYRGAVVRPEPKEGTLEELSYSLGTTSGPDESIRYGLRVSCDVETAGLVTKWRFPSRSVDEVISVIERFTDSLSTLIGGAGQPPR